MTKEKAETCARSCVLMSLKFLGYDAYNDGADDLQKLWKGFFGDNGPSIEMHCGYFLNKLGT